MLLPGCQKRESEPATKNSAPAAVKATDTQVPGALSMKLDDPQVALSFLEQSDLKLQQAKDDCALLAEEHGTLGVLVRKARERATQKSVRCEAPSGSKTWSCEAEFIASGGEDSEVSDFALKLNFNVDDATRTLAPESLVCLMAG
jgi:hypothetical protein